MCRSPQFVPFTVLWHRPPVPFLPAPRVGLQQPTMTLASFLEDGTSMAGFEVKKSTGLSMI